MKALLSCVFVAVIMLSGFSNVFAEEKKKSSCNECGRTRSTIVLTCDKSVKNAKLRLNCVSTGWLSQKCYDWIGDLEAGDNRIPLSRFTADDGRRFNPDEYEVLTLFYYAGQDDASSFDWKK